MPGAASSSASPPPSLSTTLQPARSRVSGSAGLRLETPMSLGGFSPAGERRNKTQEGLIFQLQAAAGNTSSQDPPAQHLARLDEVSSWVRGGFGSPPCSHSQSHSQSLGLVLSAPSSPIPMAGADGWLDPPGSSIPSPGGDHVPGPRCPRPPADASSRAGPSARLIRACLQPAGTVGEGLLGRH